MIRMDKDFLLSRMRDFIYKELTVTDIFTVIENRSNRNTTPPAEGFGIRQDAKYEGGKRLLTLIHLISISILWKFTPLDTKEAGKNLFHH